ncbi:Z1 domain-containing protein [Priestia aryabhattai]|uniref:Z1 domain-containing protein n=1 Tax=Priestia aryabhattai TaxID=412384 RepID=UPI000C07E369|nr:Z1 domain-containing protein [Priestia aryabhattai]
MYKTNEIDKYIRIIRTVMDSLDVSVEEAIATVPNIKGEIAIKIKEALDKEKPSVATDHNMIVDPNREHVEWLPMIDRADWYYWPTLRKYLIDIKEWPIESVRSIETATDKILAEMDDPVNSPSFFTKGLVVGYVQSGKTANYTSLIAKAADTGYKLIIVIAGIHNSLRFQTQVRLDKELVGVSNGLPAGVGRPPRDKDWITLTNADLTKGDFNPGNMNTSILNGDKPILVVIKKHGKILEKLLKWLPDSQTLSEIPCLIIDDEADQASINTGGNRPYDIDPEIDDQEETPSVINGYIRQLANLFNKKAYVAYTATPFANVLIDHRAYDRESGEDLYPSSFIMSLPSPEGYFGAREIFGNSNVEGLEIIEPVSLSDVSQLVPATRKETETFIPSIPASLEEAIYDFILAGAARINRGQGKEPASMLIHTSYRTTIQEKLAYLVDEKLLSILEEWRYRRENSTLVSVFEKRWNEKFRPLVNKISPEHDVTFKGIINDISVFLEKVKVLQLHSNSDDEINYEVEPDLKAIVIGGNRLSRGLTLEGLLISYFVRLSNSYAYDTLMQMGRWFGYRNGYVDLTRIYTTRSLERQFKALVEVEDELRRDISKYKREGRTPLQVGVKIRQHPGMLVTSPPKMRAAQSVHISYQDQVSETTVFPFDNIEFLKNNIECTKNFLRSLGESIGDELVWEDVDSNVILDYLNIYKTDEEATIVRNDTIASYISRMNMLDEPELTNWTVAVMSRKTRNEQLGSIDLGVLGVQSINLIQRTVRKNTSSLGAIMSSGDEEIKLPKEQVDEIKLRLKQGNKSEEEERITLGAELRKLRSPEKGVMLIYPISKHSGHDSKTLESKSRVPIYKNPKEGEHVIGLAFIFPASNSSDAKEYITGSVGVEAQ